MGERDPFSGHRLFEVTPVLLRRADVLADLEDDDLDEISAMCEGLQCSSDQCLVAKGDETRSVYLILEGRVKIVSYAADDREVVFREMVAGQMFGELAAISGRPRSAEVWTLEETRVVRISDGSFWKLMSTNAATMRAVLQHIVELLYSLTDRVFEHDSLKVETRIHSELLRMAREQGVTGNRAVIEPAPTQADFGKRLGTNRTAVTKEFAKLQRAGIIETSQRRIVVTDVSGLAALIDRGKHTGRGWSAGSQVDCVEQAAGKPDRAPGQSTQPVAATDILSLWDNALQHRDPAPEER